MPLSGYSFLFVFSHLARSSLLLRRGCGLYMATRVFISKAPPRLASSDMLTCSDRPNCKSSGVFLDSSISGIWFRTEDIRGQIFNLCSGYLKPQEQGICSSRWPYTPGRLDFCWFEGSDLHPTRVEHGIPGFISCQTETKFIPGVLVFPRKMSQHETQILRAIWKQADVGIVSFIFDPRTDLAKIENREFP